MHLGFSGEFINFMVYKSMDGIHTLIPNIDFGKTKSLTLGLVQNFFGLYFNFCSLPLVKDQAVNPKPGME